jgi:hypothetical protein
MRFFYGVSFQAALSVSSKNETPIAHANPAIKMYIYSNKLSTSFRMKKILFSLMIILVFSSTISAQKLKLMTYNIRLDLASDGENAWPNRKAYWASQVGFYEPDSWVYKRLYRIK